MSDTDRTLNLHDALLSNGQLITELHALKIEHTRLKAAHKRLLDSVAAAPAPTPAPAVEPVTDAVCREKARLWMQAGSSWRGCWFPEIERAAQGCEAIYQVVWRECEKHYGIGAQKGGA